MGYTDFITPTTPEEVIPFRPQSTYSLNTNKRSNANAVVNSGIHYSLPSNKVTSGITTTEEVKDLSKIDIRETLEKEGINFEENFDRSVSKIRELKKRTKDAHCFVVNTTGLVIPPEALELIIKENIKEANASVAKKLKIKTS